MMSKMIERVARALYVQETGDTEGWNGPLLADRGREMWRQMAHAAIKTMRALSPAEWGAGAASLYGHSREKAQEFAKEDKFESDGFRAEAVWTDIIDEALKETQPA
jgi:hypothetical protein